MKIVPDNKCGSYRTGVLIDITVDEIVEALGFKANCIDDPDKVVNSWGFTIGDEYFGVWDYKGSHHLRNVLYVRRPLRPEPNLWGALP